MHLSVYLFSCGREPRELWCVVWPCVAVDTEDWAAGERLLMDARAQLSRDAAGPSCRVALLDTNNLLGVLWYGLGRSHVLGLEPDRYCWPRHPTHFALVS